MDNGMDNEMDNEMNNEMNIEMDDEMDDEYANLLRSNSHHLVNSLIVDKQLVESLRKQLIITPKEAHNIRCNESGGQRIFEDSAGVLLVSLRASGRTGFDAFCTSLEGSRHAVNRQIAAQLRNGDTVDVARRDSGLMTEDDLPLPLMSRCAKWLYKLTLLLVAVLILGTVLKLSGKDTALLHEAARRDYITVVKALVAAGVNVSSRDANGLTSLDIAAWHGHPHMVEYLQNATIDHGGPSSRGRRAVHSAAAYAAGNGRLNVIQHLHKLGQDVNVPFKDGWTPMHHAASQGHLTVVEYLHNNAAIDYSQPNKEHGNCPAHYAAANGHLHIVQYLHENGVGINSPDKNGWTPMHHAAAQGHLNVMQYLHNNAAIDYSQPNKDGWTPMHLAASKGHLNVMQYLHNNAAIDYSQPDKKDGNCPAHYAAANGRLHIVQYLHENGVGINLPSKNGYTPMHNAASEGHLNVMQYLHNNAAIDYSQPDKNGKTPLDYANMYGHHEAAEWLSQVAAKPNKT